MAVDKTDVDFQAAEETADLGMAGQERDIFAFECRYQSSNDCSGCQIKSTDTDKVC